jgi:hypothetical protein
VKGGEKVETLLIESADEQDMLRARLQAIKEIIDGVESRCMAVDGPVTNTRREMSDVELQRIYRLAGGTVQS